MRTLLLRRTPRRARRRRCHAAVEELVPDRARDSLGGDGGDGDGRLRVVQCRDRTAEAAGGEAGAPGAFRLVPGTGHAPPRDAQLILLAGRPRRSLKAWTSEKDRARLRDGCLLQ